MSGVSGENAVISEARWKSLGCIERAGYLYWSPERCAESPIGKFGCIALSIILKLATLFLPYVCCGSLHNRVKYDLVQSKQDKQYYYLTVNINGIVSQKIAIRESSQSPCLISGKGKLYRIYNGTSDSTYLFTLPQILKMVSLDKDPSNIYRRSNLDAYVLGSGMKIFTLRNPRQGGDYKYVVDARGEVCRLSHKETLDLIRRINPVGFAAIDAIIRPSAEGAAPPPVQPAPAPASPAAAAPVAMGGRRSRQGDRRRPRAALAAPAVAAPAVARVIVLGVPGVAPDRRGSELP